MILRIKFDKYQENVFFPKRNLFGVWCTDLVRSVRALGAAGVCGDGGIAGARVAYFRKKDVEARNVLMVLEIEKLKWELGVGVARG